MKSQRLIMLVGATTAAIITPHAIAVYTGLQVTSQQVTLQNGTLMNRYRIYAMYTDPVDYLTSVAGSPTLGNMVIQSRNVSDTGAGSNFFNPFGSTATAPTLDAIAQDPDQVHDTFVTIGVSIAEQGSGPPSEPNNTWLSPGFTGIGNVNQLNTNNGAWFHPRTPQGRADYLGDGDPLLRVLMMQLTVSSTSNVRGTVAVSGIYNNPLAGGTSFTASGQTFNSIPAPAALFVFVLAACGSRRRRTVPAPVHRRVH